VIERVKRDPGRTRKTSIVFISRRGMTGAPREAVYHLPESPGYGHKTHCGIATWAKYHQREAAVLPIRRDYAESFGRLCEKCVALAGEK